MDEAVELEVEELSGTELAAARAELDHDNDKLIFVLCALVLLAAFLLQVTGERDGVSVLGARLPEVCTVKRMGWGDCPGCGLTRSFILGVRLDPEAFRLHPAGPLLLLLTAGQLPYRGWRLWSWRGRRRRGEPEPDPDRYQAFWRVVRWGVVLGLLAGWIVKLALGA